MPLLLLSGFRKMLRCIIPASFIYTPHTMKTLFNLLFFTIPFLINAQNPTIYFDKTRCQRKLKKDIVTDLPYSILLSDHLSKIISPRQIHNPTNFTLWKLDHKIYTKVKEGPSNIPFIIDEPGNYFLQIHDRINLIFIEMKLDSLELKSTIFYNCVIHD